MTAIEWLKSTYVISNDPHELTVRNRAVCADGFSISIQGGTHFHYCNPQTHCNVYSEVELGFPSDTYGMEFLSVYSEEEDLSGVFAFVPIEDVERLISMHGGILQ